MSDEMKPCPKCKSPYGYFLEDDQYACPECDNNWNPNEASESDTNSDTLIALDANGNELKDGDSATVIKNLPVKGAPKPIKAGAKVKNIRLQEGDHNIACKIDGFGAMSLKSEFVKKS